MSLISIIIPVYNEAQCLPALFNRLLALSERTDDNYELIFVDDGSTDESREIIMGFVRQNDKVRYVFFSRNFGHEAATTAGIEYATGLATIIIDADLQDPPEVIPLLVQKWRQGYQVVYARRTARKGERVWKQATAWMFYRIINMLSEVPIPPDTGDFRLMDRCVVDAFRRCRERNRFVRGLVSWVGFKQTCVEYQRDERLAGETKYSFIKLVVLGMDVVTGFSTVLLKTGSMIGFGACLFSLFMASVVAFRKIFFGIPLPGYALLTTGLFLLGGIQLFMIGLVGEYLGRTYREVQHRPLYVVEATSAPVTPEPTFDGRSTAENSSANGKPFVQS